ncbi:hypothetical protein ABTL98_18970, partial [Acinetobacter baumannii]
IDVFDDRGVTVQTFEALALGDIIEFSWSPIKAGKYEAAVYQRDAAGTLRYYQLLSSGLHMEEEYVISGHVISNTGK